MKSKAKLITIAIITLLFLCQLLSYAYQNSQLKATKLHVNKIGALSINARLAMHEGDQEKMKKAYDQLTQAYQEYIHNPSVSEITRRKTKRKLAQTFLKVGKEEKAIQTANELLSENPDDKAALKTKAKIYEEDAARLLPKGKYLEAISIYQELISWDITPKLTASYKFMIAQIYEVQNDQQGSFIWYNKIVDEHEDLLHWPACATYSIARIYEKNGQIQQAKQLYQKIIKFYPKSGWVKAAIEAIESLDDQEA